MQNSKCKIQKGESEGFEVKSSRLKVKSEGSLRNSKFKMQNSKRGIGGVKSSRLKVKSEGSFQALSPKT
jgi:hypothetical protein